MMFAHLMGIPVEESALSLAPAGAAIVSGVVLFARSKLAGIVGWLRRHYRAGTTTHPPLLHATSECLGSGTPIDRSGRRASVPWTEGPFTQECAGRRRAPDAAAPLGPVNPPPRGAIDR